MMVACTVMNWIDGISIAGSIGTFGFGVCSLYQWTALSALRRAIKARTQTAYNNFWNVGNEMDPTPKGSARTRHL